FSLLYPLTSPFLAAVPFLSLFKPPSSLPAALLSLSPNPCKIKSTSLPSLLADIFPFPSFDISPFLQHRPLSLPLAGISPCLPPTSLFPAEPSSLSFPPNHLLFRPRRRSVSFPSRTSHSPFLLPASLPSLLAGLFPSPSSTSLSASSPTSLPSLVCLLSLPTQDRLLPLPSCRPPSLPSFLARRFIPLCKSMQDRLLFLPCSLASSPSLRSTSLLPQVFDISLPSIDLSSSTSNPSLPAVPSQVNFFSPFCRSKSLSPPSSLTGVSPSLCSTSLPPINRPVSLPIK
ncbi:hypothetical protein C8R44DRAFT_907730, partial [Mycena epipterygia]